MSHLLRSYAGKRDLTSGPLGRTLLRLALPLAAGTVLHAMYAMVDAFWLGKWSKEGLAAPGVSMPLMWLVISFSTGFGMAGTALVAQFTGAGRPREADRAAAQSLVLLCALSLALAAPVLLGMGPLLEVVRVPREMRFEATNYLLISMLGTPLIAFAIGYGAVLRGLGDTLTVLLLGVGANVLNLVLDPALIFGWGGLPALGTGGAALATLFSQFLMALGCYALLRRHWAGLHIVRADLRPDGPMLGRIVRVGLPAAVANSSNALGFTTFQGMVNSLGSEVIAAATVGFRVVEFLMVPSYAMSMATGPVVGQALGAGKPALARRAVWAAAASVAAILFLPMAFVIWQGELVGRAFAVNPDVVVEAGRFFRVVPASAFLFGVLSVFMAGFYGSGQTRPVMVVSVVRLWLVRIPAGYVMGFVLGWGSVGVYAGMVAGNVVASAAAVWFFLRGGWQKAVAAPVAAAHPKG